MIEFLLFEEMLSLIDYEFVFSFCLSLQSHLFKIQPKMKKILLALSFISQISFSQKLKIDTKTTYQTIHSFGASDCWSMQMVGENYPLEKREKIANLLFSKELDTAGNPKGIGLSMWRFNIGAGSTEQGVDSKITNGWRRAECFLENGKYNWDKQRGQRWFLEAAKRKNVDFTLGFLNSAPFR